MIKCAHHFPAKLNVRFLVNANRHKVGLIKHNVSRHQNRIAHQPIVNVVRLQAHLVFKMRQVCKLAQRGKHTQDCVQLRMLRHMALHKHN